MPNLTNKQIDLLNSLGRYYPVFRDINKESLFGNILNNISNRTSQVIKKTININSPTIGDIYQAQDDVISRIEIDILDTFDDPEASLYISGNNILMDDKLSDLNELNKFICLLNEQMNSVMIQYNINKGDSTKGELEISIFKG